MGRIVLITIREKGVLTISHGVDEDTFANVCLSGETLEHYSRVNGAYFDQKLGEYVLPDTNEGKRTK